ncbi:hypothetical protein KGF57_004118 [Candida theae]|uniref:SWI/SNF and RSC complexes subunit Ssr4 C-terminal domain-containing protein n=1 Tax=Candida theae TaxID=1198502 RepID=A0AAD5BBR0_9ASCO|nr:uncharacterized protein KGF57_004118 [Candida theae]KAI5952930.1 hypothetical protein KGF57_004118 [Candida theae]
MPHPGRPKGRMNKKTQALQQEALARQQAAQMQAAQANRLAQEQQRHHHSKHEASNIKEEAGIQLHDEADLITYRNDALIRYMTNHEYIENVLAKPIHTSKILPPSLYPTLPKRNVEDYGIATPEEIYYGDLQYMKYVDEQLRKSVSIMKQEDDPGFVKYLFNSDNYSYRRAKFAELVTLQQELNDKGSVEKLDNEYQSIIQECKDKFLQEYKFQSNTKVYSIPLQSLRSDVDVQRAPEDYNPKDYDTVVSPKEEQQQPAQSSHKEVVVSNADANTDNGEKPDGATSIDNNDFNSNDIDLDLDSNPDGMFQFVDEANDNFDNLASSITDENNGPSQKQHQGQHQGQHQEQQQQMSATSKSEPDDNASAQNPPDSAATASNSNSNSNSDNIRSDTNAISTAEPQQSQQSPEAQQTQEQDGGQNVNDVGQNDGDDDDQLNNAMVAEINDLFNDNDHDMDHHSAIVNDDIGDLYNFDQGDNGDLLGGSEFEQDFLSQINQSME